MKRAPLRAPDQCSGEACNRQVLRFSLVARSMKASKTCFESDRDLSAFELNLSVDCYFYSCYYSCDVNLILKTD